MGDLQHVLDALGSPIRREILWLVWVEERTVGEIVAAFDVQPPTISAHLAVLRDAGLVTMRVDGNFRRYRAERGAIRGMPRLLFDERSRWVAADGLPERELASVRTHPAVSVSVELDQQVEDVFRVFVDADLYSAWLGVPVRLDGPRFAATMEWGTEVRGSYEVVVVPSLIAFRWSFADGSVPVPGDELPGYLRFGPGTDGATRVEVHQLVDDEDQARFMDVAWSMVLGRLQQGIAGALASGTVGGPRPPARARRPKRSS